MGARTSARLTTKQAGAVAAGAAQWLARLAQLAAAQRCPHPNRLAQSGPWREVGRCARNMAQRGNLSPPPGSTTTPHLCFYSGLHRTMRRSLAVSLAGAAPSRHLLLCCTSAHAAAAPPLPPGLLARHLHATPRAHNAVALVGGLTIAAGAMAARYALQVYDKAQGPAPPATAAAPALAARRAAAAAAAAAGTSLRQTTAAAAAAAAAAATPRQTAALQRGAFRFKSPGAQRCWPSAFTAAALRRR